MNQILNILLLQADGGAEDSAGNVFADPTFLLMLGGMFLIFYFFMIRPQQKKEKEKRLFRESMKKGDKVMSIGGIHGVVNTIDEDSILLEVDNKGTKIRFRKSAITPIEAGEEN